MSDSLAPSLRSALRACRQHFTYAVGFSAALNALFLAPTIYMLQIYDRVIPSRSGTTLVLLTLVLILALAAQAALDGVRSRLLVRASIRLDRELAAPVFQTALTAARTRGEQTGSQTMRQFDVVRQALTGPAMIALSDLPWAPLYLLVCFLLHPLLGVLALVGIAAVAGVAIWTERRTSQPLRDAQEAAQVAYALQDQVIMRADIVSALGMRGAMAAQHQRERETMLTAQARASFAAGSLLSLSKFLRLALQSLALGLGAALAIDDRISAGAIFAASFLVNRAMAPIDQVVAQWQAIIQARIAYTALERMLNETPFDIEHTRLPAPAGKLEIDGLTLARGKQNVIDGVTFAIEAGEAMAIIGPSGAGKSTLLRMLAGAELPTGGTIRIDGAEQRDWDTEELARHIGFLPQDVGLLPGSIKQNISRFVSNLPAIDSTLDEQVVAAAQRAGAHELVLHLPGGYDYRLGAQGRGVSAGQAQRIGLARALFGNPAILLLDEPNAQLDAEGEIALFKVLTEMKAAGHSIIFSTHRTGLLRLADKIMVLRDGALAHFGPHDEVLRQLQPVPQQGQSRQGKTNG